MAENVSKTPIGVVGIVKHASHADEIGFYIEVQDDRKGSTGGLYVLTWRGSEGYDGWVERLEDVEAYFNGRGYEVDWLSEDASHAVRQRSTRDQPPTSG